MTTYRVTVDYGDDRLRTYAVKADTVEGAERIGLEHAYGLLTVAASDDWEDYDLYDADDTLAE